MKIFMQDERVVGFFLETVYTKLTPNQRGQLQIDKRNEKGRSLLWFACQKGFPGVVQFLLR